MKKIALNKGFLLLPESWEELTQEQREYAFELLRQVFDGTLTPEAFRQKMLFLLTGYKPKMEIFSMIFRYVWYIFQKPFVCVYLLLRYRHYTFSSRYKLWKQKYKPRYLDRSIINHNLFRLSEQIGFAFTLENNVVRVNKTFASNPLPYIKIGESTYKGKQFRRGITFFTDITVREFCDCVDICTQLATVKDKNAREQLLNLLVSILYPADKDYNTNLVDNHAAEIASLPAWTKFAVYFWFSGIVDYYFNHPVYSILFRTEDPEKSKPGKYSLGMNSAYLHVSHEGYDIRNMTLNDFFEAQVKYLKDTLSEAIASGAEKKDLAESTRLTISQINELTK